MNQLDPQIFYVSNKNAKKDSYNYKRRGQIPNRTSISERPDIVDLQVRVGDFEGDLIIGKAHKGAVISLVDPKSLSTLLSLTPSKEATRASEKNHEAYNLIITAGSIH